MKTRLLFSAVCTFFTFSMYAVLPTEKAYYPLATDLNATVGTFGAMDNYGATFATDDSKFTNAVDFDQASSAYIEMDPTLYNFDAVTINIWFYCRTVDTWSRIFTFGAGNGNQLPEAFFTPADGRTTATPAFGVDLTAGGTGTTRDITDTLTMIEVNKWYMLTCCADINFGYFYLNGKLISKMDISAMATSPKDYTFDIAWLGKSGWPDPYFNGRMTKMRVYDKVLTAAEIDELLKLDGGLVGVKNLTLNNINVYSENGRILINNVNPNAKVNVYNLAGMLIQSKLASEISNVQLKQGMYIVKVDGVNYSGKVVIR